MSDIISIPQPVFVDPCLWLIYHGPLLDRFGGVITLAFLESTIPRVVALRINYYGRKWLDLRNPDLQAGFYYMAGLTMPVLGTISTPIDGLTTSIIASVFATPVDPKDNVAVRKSYFS